MAYNGPWMVKSGSGEGRVFLKRNSGKKGPTFGPINEAELFSDAEIEAYKKGVLETLGVNPSLTRVNPVSFLDSCQKQLPVLEAKLESAREGVARCETLVAEVQAFAGTDEDVEQEAAE